MYNYLKYFTIILFFLSGGETFSQIYLYQGFESGGLPSGWSNELIYGSTNWRYENGGFAVDPMDNLSRRPLEAYAGNKNAIFQVQNLTDTTILITKPLDSLEFAIRPLLTFYHSQYGWCHKPQDQCISDPNNLDWDKLSVHVRKTPTSEWILLASYTQRVAEWLYREILIPDSVLTDQTQIGFKGITNWGYGTCIDEIKIIETGIIPREPESIIAHETGSDKIPSRSELNPVFRLDLKIKGNTGSLSLDSLLIGSDNTEDNDISEYGIKLYQTTDTLFEHFVLIDSAIAFENGTARFSNLGLNLQTGYTTLWIALDVDSAAGHGNTIDLFLPAEAAHYNYDTAGIFVHDNMIDVDNDILEYTYIGNTYYMPLHLALPATDQNPAGERTIFQTIFIDGFETDMGWILTGEWERDEPQGLKDWSDISYGDPSTAYRGSRVLGTDLTGLGSEPGDYQDLADTSWVAISPPFDFTYFNDLSVFYARWLNTDNNDNANFTVSTDSMQTWQHIWENNSLFFENEWHVIDHSISSLVNRSDNVFFKFNIGPTDATWNLSGWNIDNFVITGNYITADVGIFDFTSPVEGCGMTSDESVTVIIKNFGAEASNDTIPLSYSVNGGSDFVRDTLFESIPVGESRTFTFTEKADLTAPGAYPFMFRTDLPDDEDPTNDEITRTIVSQPIFTPPYTEHFENEQGYWRRTSFESSWEWGTLGIPSPLGGKGWTNIRSGYYPNNDSSFIESPCFDFSQLTYPIFDFYLRIETEPTEDGFLLQYSIDGGTNWNVCDTNTYGYNWPWYNDTVWALEHRGWTGNDNWKNQKQFLPAPVAGESSVKFRFWFASNEDTARDGALLDAIKIYDAPYDVGIAGFDSVENACQFVNPEQISVVVKNYGVRSLQASDTLIIGLEASRNTPFIDTLVLEQALASGDSVILKLNTPINLDTTGQYDMMAYTLIEDEPYFYTETSNDTTTFTFYVHPNPVTTLTDTIKSGRPDTLTIHAYYDPLYLYTWSPAGGEDDSVYHVLNEGNYFLTVTNSDSTNCSSFDSIHIHRLINDLEIDSLLTPVSSCELTTKEIVEVRLKNIGADTLFVNDTIILGYTVDIANAVRDTIILQEKFYPDSTQIFKIKNDSTDLSAFSTYQYTVFLEQTWDNQHENDTLKKSITTWGYPSVDLGDDVIKYTVDHIIDAGAGYSTYSWSTGGTAQQDTVTKTNDYYVTITDENGCPATDTVYVKFEYLDIGITAINQPFNQCFPYDSTLVTAVVTNTGTDTIIDNAVFDLGYRLNGGDIYTNSLALNQDLLPDSSLIHTFSQKQFLETPGDYTLEVFSSVAGDINSDNDTLTEIISYYPYPQVDLGVDTLVKAYSYPLNAGNDTTHTYTWSTGEDTSSISVSSPGTYAVTVTSVNNCSSYDTVKAVVVAPDLTISGLLNPTTDCIPKDSVKIKVNIYNNGTDTVFSGETITLGFLVNDSNLTTEPFSLSAHLYPNANRVYEFTSYHTFKNPGVKNIKAFVLLDEDINHANDTLAESITLYPYPEVNLGPDSLVKAYNYTLDAGYDSTFTYAWNTGADTAIILVSTSDTYTVDVTSSEGCLTKDTAIIEMVVPDVQITEILQPLTSCMPKDPVNVRVRVYNNGTDTLPPGEMLTMEYRVNEGALASEVFTLTSKLDPQSSVDFIFTNVHSFTLSGSNQIEAFTTLDDDINRANDTLLSTFSMYPYPEVNLGADTLIKAYTHELVAGIDPTYLYTWNTGESSSSININNSDTYKVDVTSPDGCTTTDSIAVQMRIPDIALSQLLRPLTSCLPDTAIHIKLRLTNNGTDTIFSSETLVLGYSINESPFSTENYTLSANLVPGDSMDFEFSNGYDFLTQGSKTITSFVLLNDDIYPANDTLTETISLNAYPEVNLGQDTLVKDYSYSLNAGSGTGFTYSWNTGSSDPVIEISNTGIYSVTVTSTEGCITIDTVNVQIKVPDIQLTGLLSPFTECMPDTPLDMTYRIKNTGTDTLLSGQSIPIGYSINEGLFETENIILSGNLFPNDSIDYTFASESTIQEPGVYNITSFVAYSEDINSSNDTLINTVSLYEYPKVNLGADTLIKAYSHELVAGTNPAFTYAWNTGDNTESISINASGVYRVDVSSPDGCTTTDSIAVQMRIPDIALSQLLRPVTSCMPDTPVDLKIRLTNEGTDTLFGGETLVLGYSINESPFSTENYTLSANLVPGDSMDFEFSDGYDFLTPGSKTITSFVILNDDIYPANDTLTKTISLNAYPEVNLGQDTLVKDYSYSLNAGSGTGFTYSWNTGSSDPVIEISNTGIYSVTVTSTEGCITIDTVNVQIKVPDIQLTGLLSPFTECMPETPLDMTYRIKNTGTDTLLSGQAIPIGYSINEGLFETENIILSGNLFPNDSIDYTFASESTLQEPGVYNITGFVAYSEDINSSNDTLINTVSLYEYPEVNLGADTLIKAYSHELVAGTNPAFTYAWNTGDNTESISINASGVYRVDVSSPDGCTTTDSIAVQMRIPDIALSQLLRPVTSCMPDTPVDLKIRLTNEGTDTIFGGETLVLGYSINESPFSTENYTLSANLVPGDSMDFEFSDGYDFLTPGSKTITSFVILNDDIYPANDTLTKTISLNAYPEVNLGQDTLVKDYSYSLNAGSGTGFTYSWNTGSSDPVLEISNTGIYSVTVTSPEGCITIDTVNVQMKVPDIQLTGLLSPFTECMPETPLDMTYRIKNTGTDTLLSGQSIPIGYSINEGLFETENIILSGNLFPNDSIDYTFASESTLQEPGVYNIIGFVAYSEDINSSNDTLINTVSLYEYPEVNLGKDTLLKAFSYTLDAGNPAGNTYIWNTGDASSSITVNESGTYSVIVTSDKGCVSLDTIAIDMISQDIQIVDLVSPENSCTPSEEFTIEIEIHNGGSDTLYAGETISLGYALNENSYITAQYELTSDFLPSSSIRYVFDDKAHVSNPGILSVQTFATYANDIDDSNDTIKTDVTFYAYPEVELGRDTLIKTGSIVLVAGTDESYTYEWQDGSKESTYTATINGNYEVAVTSAEGCVTTDDINLSFTLPDLGIIALLEPSDLCGHTEKNVKVQIKNMGSDTVRIGEILSVNYMINGQKSTPDEIIMETDLLPGDTLDHTFANKADMTVIGEYEFKVFTILNRDLWPENDTLTQTLSIMEVPTIDFGPKVVNDTLISNLPTSLDAGSGFKTYLWNDGQRNRLHIIQTPGWYEVTVTNANGCSTSRGAFVDSTNVDEPCDTCETYIENLPDQNIRFNIYPNPARDFITFDITTGQPEEIFYTLYNAAGQAIRNQSINVWNHYRETVPVQFLPDGVYSLKVFNHSFARTYRIIIQ